MTATARDLGYTCRADYVHWPDRWAELRPEAHRAIRQLEQVHRDLALQRWSECWLYLARLCFQRSVLPELVGGWVRVPGRLLPGWGTPSLPAPDPLDYRPDQGWLAECWPLRVVMGHETEDGQERLALSAIRTCVWLSQTDRQALLDALRPHCVQTPAELASYQLDQEVAL